MIWALHGAVGMAADWRDPAKSFPANLGEIRRVDLWRYLDCCPMSLEETGRALATEISRVDSEPVLLGYSMGGRIALHALLAMPEVWRAAVFVSTHPGLTDDQEKEARRKSDAEWSALALKAEWREFLHQWNEQGVLASNAQLPDRMKLKSSRASIARSFIDWSLGTQENLTSELAQHSVPQLWLTGGYDQKFTQLAAGSTLSIPSAKHTVIPGCGHRLPWEKPAEMARQITRFLEVST
ncbi:MAG: alpha/beta fold hydrolase [Akkermansiaceae bacterium]